MQESREWSWVGRDGIEHGAVEDELTFALSSEELPPYILVCKRGWSVWLPAMQVAELAWALPPGTADTPRKPEVRLGGVRLAPPLHDYDELAARAADIKSGVIDPTLTSTASLPPVAPTPEQATESAAPVPDEELEELSFEYYEGEVETAIRQKEDVVEAVPASKPAPTHPFPPLGQYGATPVIDVLAEPVLEEPEDSARPPLGSAPPPTGAPSFNARLVEPGSPSSRSSATWWMAAGLLGAGFTGLWVWAEAKSSAADPAPAAPKLLASSTAAPTDRPTVECQMSAGPTRIGEWAQPKIKPLLRTYKSAGADRVGVGYAKTSRYALGVSLNPENLIAEELFSNYESSPLASVAVSWQADTLEFWPGRAATTLQSQVTMDSPIPYAIGISKAGFAVRHPNATVDEVLWASPWKTISVPSAASVADGNFAVAFRAGGERGAIEVAKVSQEGKGLSAPRTVRNSASRLGQPSLTSSATHLMLTFAAGQATRQESIFVGVSEHPELPKEARPALSSETGCSSPSLLQLPNNNLLLQWTAGTPGKQRVVAQAYDQDLSPIGPEFLVSPSARDAHSGVLTALQPQVLSVYMVRNGESHELWATTFDCQ